MTFTQQLNKAKELGLDILDLAVANECENCFVFDHTDEQFEKLCYIVRACWIKSDICTMEAIAMAVNQLITCNHKTINDVYAMSYYTILGVADTFMNY